MKLESTITCPHCGHKAHEIIPTTACQYFYDCNGCATVRRPKTGNRCVFCSNGTVSCRPIQETGKGNCCA